MLIQGSCHCRNIRFTLDWTPDPAEIPARACGCSFCLKHGGVWTSTPTGLLDVVIEHPEERTPYEFGTRTATFHVCRRCGGVPVVTSAIDGNLFAVVSVNAFEGVAQTLLRRSGADFDGETTESRLARRKKGWIPHVRFVQGGA